MWSTNTFRDVKRCPCGTREISGRLGAIFRRSSCAVTAEQDLKRKDIEVRVSGVHCWDVREAGAGVLAIQSSLKVFLSAVIPVYVTSIFQGGSLLRMMEVVVEGGVYVHANIDSHA